jgi:hypothetical protein
MNFDQITEKVLEIRKIQKNCYVTTAAIPI